MKINQFLKHNSPGLFFLLTALEAMLSSLYLMRINTDLKNQVLFGYSLPRLVVLFGFLTVIILSLILGVYNSYYKDKTRQILNLYLIKSNRSAFFFVLFIILFELAFIYLCMPFNRYGIAPVTAYGDRMRPVFLFLCLFFLHSLIFLTNWKKKHILTGVKQVTPKIRRALIPLGLLFLITSTLFLIPNTVLGSLRTISALIITPLSLLVSITTLQLIIYILHDPNKSYLNEYKNHIKRNKQILLIVGIIFSLCMIAWIVILLTGIGNSGNWQNFSSPGVPLLTAQVWFLICVVIFLNKSYLFLIKKNQFTYFWQKHKDLIICLIIFFITAGAWILTPVKPNLYAPGPNPPNFQEYPNSDAAIWDMNGHTALIGQGYANGDVSMDHLGYSAFLAILNYITGSNYSTMINLQVVVLSTIPVFVFLLGRALHNRITGFLAAGMVTFHGVNKLILRPKLGTSDVKLMMTEYPTAFLLCMLAVLLVYWLKDCPKQKIGLALPVGGTLAILSLTRFTTLLIPFGVIGILLFVFRRQLKLWLWSSFLILLSMFIVLTPWIWRSWKYSGTPFFFKAKASLALQEDFRISNDELVEYFSRIEDQEEYIPTNTDTENTTSPKGDQSDIPLPGINQEFFPPGGFFLNHLTHSLISSVLIIPTSPNFQDLKSTVIAQDQFRHNLNSQNTVILSLSETILLFIGLLILCVGITYAGSKSSISGLVPLILLFIYITSCAIARTSGGRYIIAVDWVIILYYAIGLNLLISSILKPYLIYFGTQEMRPQSAVYNTKKVTMKKGFQLVLPFLIFVSLMTVMDRLIPQKYSNPSPEEILIQLNSIDFFSKTGIDPQSFENFLDYPNTMTYLGLNLYPRFMQSREGYPIQHSAYLRKDYPNLAFNLVGHDGIKHAFISISSVPIEIPNAVNTLVIGCEPNEAVYAFSTIDTRIIIFFEKEPLIILSEPFVLDKCQQESK